VTLLLAPPFWFVVQFVWPVGAGGEETVGAGVGGALCDGLEEADGLGGGVDGELDGELGKELGDGVEDGAGLRFRRALGDELAFEGDGLEEGLASGLDDDAGLDWATQCSRIELAGHSGTLTDTPLSFPDDRQA
jgi:hypothetical protein